MIELDALAPMDVAGRLDRLRERFGDLGIDALVVTRLPNVRYLTSFTGSAGTLALTDAAAIFVTDGRYDEQAHEQLTAAGVRAEISLGATAVDQRSALLGLLARARRIGLEAHGVTWAQQRTWRDAVDETQELVPTADAVEELRRVKDSGEVARIEVACRIADDAFAALVPSLTEGPTEGEFARELETEMRRRGASGPSFESIIAAGPHGAKPHARPSGRPIGAGELVVCDFGCVVEGYCSDMTRTISVGEPDEQGRRMYELVLDAQARGVDAVGPGVDVTAVDAACRDVIAAAGFGERFVHGTGHGVGVEIHEAPRLARSASGSLRVGDVVTVEPGVYLPGVGGVRIEDTVVVTAEGSRTLTTFPKDLVP